MRFKDREFYDRGLAGKLYISIMRWQLQDGTGCEAPYTILFFCFHPDASVGGVIGILRLNRVKHRMDFFFRHTGKLQNRVIGIAPEQRSGSVVPELDPGIVFPA